MPVEVIQTLAQKIVAQAQQRAIVGSQLVDFARFLGHPPVNTPIGEVRRVLYAPDRTVLYLGEATYRGDYICLEMDLKP